jgi:hypothetical protein
MREILSRETRLETIRPRVLTPAARQCMFACTKRRSSHQARVEAIEAAMLDSILKAQSEDLQHPVNLVCQINGFFKQGFAAAQQSSNVVGFLDCRTPSCPRRDHIVAAIHPKTTAVLSCANCAREPVNYHVTCHPQLCRPPKLRRGDGGAESCTSVGNAHRQTLQIPAVDSIECLTLLAELALKNRV